MTPQKLTLANRLDKSSQGRKKKKVKGNLGLVTNVNDVADAVQLGNVEQFDEDDILGDDSDAEKKKVKGDDDFGMSSDEEKEIAKLK